MCYRPSHDSHASIGQVSSAGILAVQAGAAFLQPAAAQSVPGCGRLYRPAPAVRAGLLSALVVAVAALADQRNLLCQHRTR